MKRFVSRILLVGACPVVFGISPAVAQQVTLAGGNQTLTVLAVVPGNEPTAVTNALTTVTYRRQNSGITKLTVETVCPSQKWTLRVLAISPQAGVAAPEVTLVNSMPPTDLITNIPQGPPPQFRDATLQYTASALFSQGNSVELGDDAHTVTYTLVAQ